MQQKKLLIIVGDIILFYTVLFVALIIRQREIITNNQWNEHWPAFSIVLIIWIIVFYINELYDLNLARNTPALLNKISAGIFINFVLAALFFYITNRFWNIRPQTILIIHTILYAIVLYLWRQIINKAFISQALTNNVLYIGFNAISKQLMKYIFQHPQLGYKTCAVIDDFNPHLKHIPSFDTHRVDIKLLLNDQHVNTIVISSHHYKNPSLLNSLYENLSPEIKIVNLLKFYEEITGKIPIELVGQIWALENLTTSSGKTFLLLKRASDIIGTIILGVIALMLTPIISLVIILDNGFPIFFTQTRVGYLGKRFKAIKFRTMKKNAEKDGPEWAQKDDPRVTQIGKFLRKTRLDELPQFWNVLKGDMSIIGPRPERPEFVKNLLNEIPFYKERLLVKPGITGWAQINFPYGASKKDALEKLQYDLYYIKNKTIGLELSIILKTIKTMLIAQGH